jgi:hypothetical protein
MTHEALDEVVFDYLEGNLSAEEKEAFEVLMNESEVTSYHVKLWRNAYVEEALPSVETLENMLLRPVPHSKPVVQPSLWQKLIIGLAITISAFIIQNPQVELESFSVTTSTPKIMDGTVPELEPKVIETECPTAMGSVENINPVSSDKGISREIYVETLPVSLTISNVNTSVFKQVLTGDSELIDFEIRMTEFGLGHKTVKRKLSASERRSINRKKRQEYEEKRAARFMKGNVPYVVPLKSNNF